MTSQIKELLDCSLWRILNTSEHGKQFLFAEVGKAALGECEISCLTLKDLKFAVSDLTNC